QPPGQLVRLLHRQPDAREADGWRLHGAGSHLRPDADAILPIPSSGSRGGAMNRRLFLKGIGRPALAAPFLSSITRPAPGQEASDPRRLVIFYTQNGCLTNRWFPKVESGTIDADSLAGTTLAGLAPLADKLLFPRGLALYPAYFRGQDVDPHDQAMGSKLT